MPEGNTAIRQVRQQLVRVGERLHLVPTTAESGRMDPLAPLCLPRACRNADLPQQGVGEELATHARAAEDTPDSELDPASSASCQASTCCKTPVICVLSTSNSHAGPGGEPVLKATMEECELEASRFAAGQAQDGEENRVKLALDLMDLVSLSIVLPDGQAQESC